MYEIGYSPFKDLNVIIGQFAAPGQNVRLNPPYHPGLSAGLGAPEGAHPLLYFVLRFPAVGTEITVWLQL